MSTSPAAHKGVCVTIFCSGSFYTECALGCYTQKLDRVISNEGQRLPGRGAHTHTQIQYAQRARNTSPYPIFGALTFNSGGRPKLIPAHLPDSVSMTDHS